MARNRRLTDAEQARLIDQFYDDVYAEELHFGDDDTHRFEEENDSSLDD